MITARTIQAYLTLAAALIKRVIVMMVIPFARRRGAEAWLDTLARESLARTPADAWSYLASTSRCIGCGLCDVADAELSGSLMGLQRRPEDALLALDEAVRLRELAGQISRVCPARVSPEAIARLIDDSAAELTARTGGAP